MGYRLLCVTLICIGLLKALLNEKATFQVVLVTLRWFGEHYGTIPGAIYRNFEAIAAFEQP